jgi:hypothetical protein
LFTVDAPLAEIGSDSDSEDDMPDIGRDSDEEDDEDEDEQDFEDSEKEDEDEDEEDEEDSGSDSAPEFDVASENEGEYEETGANAPKITVPKGVVDFDEEEINGKGKGKAVWHDAADERVNVDMEKDNRLKKLARGKKGGVVDGAELQKRLKQQYVHSSLSRIARLIPGLKHYTLDLNGLIREHKLVSPLYPPYSHQRNHLSMNLPLPLLLKGKRRDQHLNPVRSRCCV